MAKANANTASGATFRAERLRERQLAAFPTGQRELRSDNPTRNQDVRKASYEWRPCFLSLTRQRTRIERWNTASNPCIPACGAYQWL
jgi:hypothetical protein